MSSSYVESRESNLANPRQIRARDKQKRDGDMFAIPRNSVPQLRHALFAALAMHAILRLPLMDRMTIAGPFLPSHVHFLGQKTKLR